MRYRTLLLGLAVAGIGAAFLVRADGQRNSQDATPVETAENALVFQETEFDFGTVTQSGGTVTHAFPFSYQGEKTVTLRGLPTSCGCTSAEVDVKTLSPGTRGTITVAFDPNLHAEPTVRFYKTVTLLTDPPLDGTHELKIWVQIDLDLGPQSYKQQTHTDDDTIQTENPTPEKIQGGVSF